MSKTVVEKIVERATSKRTNDWLLMFDDNVRSKQISGNQVCKIRSITRLVLSLYWVHEEIFLLITAVLDINNENGQKSI